jgi:hypothetical protein
MNFIPLSFKSEKFTTFKTFSWNFKLNNEEFSIILECFLLSNKRRVLINKLEVFIGTKPYFKDFEWSSNWNKHVISLINGKTKTDLIIDGVSFTYLFNLKLSNRMYQQVEEVKVNQQVAPNGKLEDYNFPSLKDPFTEDKKISSSSSNYDFEQIFK